MFARREYWVESAPSTAIAVAQTTTPTAVTTTSASCSYPVSAAKAPVIPRSRLLSGTLHIAMKTSSPRIDNDVHALTPTTRSAARKQADLTNSLRAASCAVPDAWAISNALMYARPCLRRIPKALLPRNNTVNGENVEKSAAISCRGPSKHLPFGQDTSARNPLKESAASTRGVTAPKSRITIACATAIDSNGSPVDLKSNQTCARVADEMGHGKRNRSTSRSQSPSRCAGDSAEGSCAHPSPRRCRATPATVTPNDAR